MATLFSRTNFIYIFFINFWFITVTYPQDLEDLLFGDNYSLDIATWNVEWFPKNDQITIDYVTQIITLLDIDIFAIQELDDTIMFDQM